MVNVDYNEEDNVWYWNLNAECASHFEVEVKERSANVSPNAAPCLKACPLPPPPTITFGWSGTVSIKNSASLVQVYKQDSECAGFFQLAYGK